MKKNGNQYRCAHSSRSRQMDCLPFQCLLGKEDVYYPPVDLVEMFLTLADKYNMAFYFGMYDSGKYWQEGLFQKEIDLNMALIDEVWKKYGHHKSFQGWYLSQEISRRTKNMSKIYGEVRGNMPKQFPGICRPWSLLIYTE